MKFLTCHLDKAFEDHLKNVKQIDIAVAWVTESCPMIKDGSLYEAVKRGAHLRFITGLDKHNGTITSPPVLYRLLELRNSPGRGKCELYAYDRKIHGKNSGKFHPKVFIFYKKSGEKLCWAGSANMTAPAFIGINEEAVCEFIDSSDDTKGDAQEWFDGLPIKQCTKKDVDAYKVEYDKNPGGLPKPKDIVTVKNFQQLISLVRADMGWDDFVKAIRKADAFWKKKTKNRRKGEFNVYPDSYYGQRRSWVDTIEHIKPLMDKDKSWNKLSKIEKYAIRGNSGRDYSHDFALLGNLTQVNELSKENTMRKIKQHLDNIPCKRTPASREDVVSAFENIIRMPGIGISTASRLLAHAHPDIAVSAANEAVRINLVKLAGLSRSKSANHFIKQSGKSEKHIMNKVYIYGEILKWVHERSWHGGHKAHAPSGISEFEKKIWSMRAALLDAFLYKI